MSTPTLTAVLIAFLSLVTVLAAPAAAGGTTLAPARADRVSTATFPNVTGDNLSGKSYRLPGDLEGDLNLLLIAFRRQQQKDVDTWMALGDDLEKRFKGFRYYEIPTIDAGYTVVRGFIDGGMRGGIPSLAQRNRTITLYIDKAPYRKSLNIASEDTIRAALVDRSGRVHYMAEGRHSEEKAKALLATIEKKLAAKTREGGNADEAAGAPRGDIIETALASGRFTVLARALGTAGLVKALQGDGPFTVFAPTDEAFAKLPKGTVEELLKPANREKLVGILTYHVREGRYPASRVVGSRSAVTLAKKPVAFETRDGVVLVNGAKVVAADVAATNGVIHVIDTVLLPPTRPAVVKRDVRGFIELAYERGVPLFNAGQVEACAAIYEVAALSLLSFSGNLSEKNRARLVEALEAASAGEDARRNAWTLRRALDAVYLSSPGASS